jgi:3-hexulose-6-phosphate synthase
MHAGLDEQAEVGFTFETLLTDGEASGVSFSVAGGVKLSTIAAVQKAGADVAVAGGALYGAADPAAAAAELRAAIV